MKILKFLASLISQIGGLSQNVDLSTSIVKSSSPGAVRPDSLGAQRVNLTILGLNF